MQPFVPEIVSEGEFSYQFFAGQFSHAVVMEVELIEPELYFEQQPEAARAMVSALRRLVAS